MKVLACDGIHEDGLALFRDAGWDVLVSPPIKDADALKQALADADAVLVRSATQITADAAQFLGTEQQHDDDCDDQQLPNTDTTHDFLSRIGA